MNRIRIGNLIVPTLLAISEEEQRRGLMYQEWPPPVMTFVYATAQKNTYWMKNTYVPLDIIFCLGGKIRAIDIGVPLSEELIGPDYPTDLVIEMPHGAVKKMNISCGTDVEIIYDINGIRSKLAAKYKIY